MKVTKHKRNPIIKTSDIKPSRDDFEVVGAFNAGATLYNDKFLLLIRIAEKPINNNDNIYLTPIFNKVTKQLEVKEFNKNDSDYDFSDPRVIRSKNGRNFLTSISHLRLAISNDGVNFDITDNPLIAAFDDYSTFGIEDPRITKINNTYYINFSAASSLGIVTKLFSTEDFKNFKDYGNIFHPDNKDVAIFPEKINGLYYALHRPSTSEYGKPNLWIASSPDLIHWGNNRVIATVREGKWDNGRMGASCVPILTDRGWLEIYHGASKDNRYCLGAMLLDRNEPWKIIARYEKPIIEPTEKYEIEGFFGNVVFGCGLIQCGDELKIYYGAADNSVCLATTTVKQVLECLD